MAMAGGLKTIAPSKVVAVIATIFDQGFRERDTGTGWIDRCMAVPDIFLS